MENGNRISTTQTGLILNHKTLIFMTDEELDSFKELAESIQQNSQQAYEIYKNAVDRIYTDNSQDENEIECLLDYLVGYCYDEKMLILFKKLCRHYYKINPVATAEYVMTYKDMWDEEATEEEV